ncbi:MAG: 3-isopropylmalate dehydratase small subunit [Pusillimonas sp.]
MKPVHSITGIAAPLPIVNLDTDQIMPKQFLRGIDKRGLDKGLLYDLRFDERGEPRPAFILNQGVFADTSILVGAANFGCGSSREHAVWGLMQYGIQAVIAPSFGEIFYSNALNNRLLAAQVDESDYLRLLEITTKHPGTRITLDVETLKIRADSHVFSFHLAPRHQQALLDGMDMIGATLKAQAAIEAFARDRAQTHPWLHDVGRKAFLYSKKAKLP